MNLIQQHFVNSCGALSSINDDQLKTLTWMAEQITHAFRNGNKLLICGNGGSAGDAQHIAAEFVVRLKRERRALPALALTVDSSVLTAGANDFGYATVFERQVEAFGVKGDILWALSTSGQSENVQAAANEAKLRGMQVFAFTGEDASRLARTADMSFCAGRATAITQQLHMVAAHAICDQVEDSIMVLPYRRD